MTTKQLVGELRVEIAGLRRRIEAIENGLRTGAFKSEDDPADQEDEPEGDYCPECGVPESYCICDDPDSQCRSCGTVSLAIDNGLCGMCFEMQGGILLPGQ